MNIEELKLILETVSAVSGQASYVAVAYVVLSSLKPIVIVSIIGFVAVKIVKMFGFEQTEFRVIHENKKD